MSLSLWIEEQLSAQEALAKADAWADASGARPIFFDAKHRPRAIPAPQAPLVDTHAHLTMLGGEKVVSQESQAKAAEALARAWLFGVTWVVCVADASEDARDPRAFLDWLSRVEEAAQAERQAALLAGLVPAFPDEPQRISLVGAIHPYGAAWVDDEALHRIRVLARDPRCVALGEMGLDYHCDLSHELQRTAFQRQLALSAELGLPVELHVRDAANDPTYRAHQEAFELVEASGVAQAGIDLHCYTLGPQALAPWLSLGASIAFGGALTFKRSDEIREACRVCPLDRVLTETDCPFMAPVPLRGTEAEPAMVVVIAHAIAEAKSQNADPSSTFAQLFANARNLFCSS